MSKHLIETPITSTQLIDGHLLKAWRDEVRLPNGATAVREYIKHPGAVIMVPLFPDRSTILIRQFRYPVGQAFIELPAGKLDAGESTESAAKRELIEEIGYRPGRLQKIAEYYPCIGYSDEKMWLYLADELTPAEQQRDHDEFLDIMRLPFTTAVDMARSGEITDLKTLAGLLLAERFLDKGHSYAAP